MILNDSQLYFIQTAHVVLVDLTRQLLYHKYNCIKFAPTCLFCVFYFKSNPKDTFLFS